MTPEEIRLAVVQLLEARHTLREAQQLVKDAEENLTEMYCSENTALSEWNTISIDTEHFDLKFGIEDASFKSLELNQFKHF
jgi:hypothetical protein